MTDSSQAFTHIGWIPCISGQLFFEFTECGLGADSVLVDVNHVEKVENSDMMLRHIVIASNVNWKDDNDQNTTGSYRVFLLAQSEFGSQYIAGHVFIVPSELAESKPEIASDTIKKIGEEAAEGGVITDLYSKLVEALTNYRAVPIYHVQFQLKHTGFVRLAMDPGRSIDDSVSINTILRQAYYYIKFAWHKHQHHNQTAESLTTVHAIRQDPKQMAVEMVGDLKKALVQLKRDYHISDYKALYQAEGIATYAKSLVTSCASEGWFDNNTAATECSYLDNTAASLHLKAEEIDRDISVRHLISATFRSLLLFVISIVAPITIIFREDIRAGITNDSVPDGVIRFMSGLIGNGWSLLILLIAGLAGYAIYRQSYLTFGSPFLAFHWFRDAIDTIVLERRKANLIAYVVIALAILPIFWGLAMIFGS